MSNNSCDNFKPSKYIVCPMCMGCMKCEPGSKMAINCI